MGKPKVIKITKEMKREFLYRCAILSAEKTIKRMRKKQNEYVLGY